MYCQFSLLACIYFILKNKIQMHYCIRIFIIRFSNDDYLHNFHKLRNMCLGCFPLRTIAFHGTASASFGSKNRFLQSLQTRGTGTAITRPTEKHCHFRSSHRRPFALPAGVNGSPLQTTAVNSDNTCYPTLSQRRKYTETPVGGKA